MPVPSAAPRFRLSLVLHAGAVAALGIMAGFFWTYTINVSPALLTVDGAVYALVQSAFNRHVRHSLFFAFFFGPPLLAALALAAGWRQWRCAWFAALGGAGLLYLLGIVFFTAQVNLPLNHYTESWNPAALPVDWAQTRDRWNTANLWRTLASGLAFALALGALAWRAASTQAARGAGSTPTAA